MATKTIEGDIGVSTGVGGNSRPPGIDIRTGGGDNTPYHGEHQNPHWEAAQVDRQKAFRDLQEARDQMAASLDLETSLKSGIDPLVIDRITRQVIRPVKNRLLDVLGDQESRRSHYIPGLNDPEKWSILQMPTIVPIAGLRIAIYKPNEWTEKFAPNMNTFADQ